MGTVIISTLYEKIYAWDTDESIQERNQLFLEKKNIKNTQLMPAFNIKAIQSIEPDDDILITEMIEHMPQEQAKQLLSNLELISFCLIFIL